MTTKSKSAKIEKSNSDSINLENAKVNLSKGKEGLTTKERKEGHSKKEIYQNLSSLNSEEQKKFRQRIRSKTRRFVNDILGKDRTDEERTKGIKEFLIFYKENWKIQDFRIENFSGSKNQNDLKDYSDLLEYVKSTLE